MLPRAFRRQVAQETEEGSFREGIRAHGLLENVLGNNHLNKIKLLCANQPRPFRELPQEKNLPQTFRGCSAALPFLVDMSTSIHGS